MKIDFHASYSQIAQLLSRPAQGPANSTGASGFQQQLLKSISPTVEPEIDAGQGNISETDKQRSAKSQQLTAWQPQSRASLRLPEFSLQSPRLERSLATEAEQELVSTIEKSVKPPAILKAQRVRPSSITPEAPQNERIQAVKDVIETVGREQGVDPALGMAVVSSESAFDPTAVSSDGHNSKGLFQLIDTTANDTMSRYGLSWEYSPFDGEQNIELGMRHLRYLLGLFSQESELSPTLKTHSAANSSSLEKLAVAAFNAGEGRVASAQQRALKSGGDPSEYSAVVRYLPKITQNYVDEVMAGRVSFSGLWTEVGSMNSGAAEQVARSLQTKASETESAKMFKSRV